MDDAESWLAHQISEAPSGAGGHMILDAVLNLYNTETDLVNRREPGRGNPTASSVGQCMAQMEMLRFPQLSHPEMRPIRSAWVFEDGDLHAADLKAKIVRAFPGFSGLSEELFYFGPIALSEYEAEILSEKIARRDIWGTNRAPFLPPFIRAGSDGEKDRMRLVDRDPRNCDRPRPMGFILDGTMLWAPLYVDHVIRHPDHGLAVIEIKTMSRFSFRRALLAEWDLRIRMQIAAIAHATGLPVVWLIKCKDSAHLLEVAFLPKADETTVEIIKTNGLRERYKIPVPGVVMGTSPDGTAAGAVVELREDETWDVGQIWTPFDDALVARIGERVKRVLLFDPADAEDWDREYGPTFDCPVCAGTGTQTLGKNAPRAPLKKPKPCEECGATGALETADLPNFPCGYCPVIRFCWERAKPTLTVTDKPRWTVRRADYEASGIVWAGTTVVEAEAAEP